uniref:Phasin family protein n=1 Tax=Archaeoglobus fulgidus TaxID=2234 RepID=A0A7C3MFQ9_ARCFL
MEYKEFMETVRGFYKMGFAITKTTLDMMKILGDSYISLYELYLRQLIPSETYEGIKKTIDLYMESQTKVFDSFRKLVDQFEKQQDEIFSKVVELGERTKEAKKA